MSCAVVLAAGEGSRFGAPKQLAQLDGRPLLQWTVDAVCASGVERVVVVLGARAQLVRAAVDFGRASVAVCDGWAEGMAASLRCGVEAAGDAPWVVVVLGDGPLLAPAAVDGVLAAAADAPEEVGAVRLRRAGRPSHPVALRRSLLSRVRELRGDEGAKTLLEDALVLELDGDALPDPGDVDTPAALDELRRRPR